MKKYYSLTFIFCLFIFKNITAQKIAAFEVELSKSANGLDVPASVNLDEITFTQDSLLSLVRVDGDKKTPVPFQIRNGDQRILYWLIKPLSNQQKKYIYELRKAAPSNFNEILAGKKDGALTFE